MSLFVYGQPGFEEDQHAEFGNRLYTAWHSPKRGKVKLIVAAALVPISLVLIYLGPILPMFLYKGTMPVVESTAVLAMFCFALVGVVETIHARQTIHVYESGLVVQERSGSWELPYDRVDAAMLELKLNLGTLIIKFRLSRMEKSATINDHVGATEKQLHQDYSSLIYYIVDRIPRSVPLKGNHDIHREY